MAWHEGELTKGAMPLWAQIADRLRAGIANGEFAEGDDLPSESELVERFRVSRATARNALGRLGSEGLVERRSGKGTRVLPPAIELPLNLLSSFSEDMASRGMKPGYGHLSVTVAKAPATVAIALAIPAETPVVQVERQLLANGAAIAYSTSWLLPQAIPIETVDELRSYRHSLYAWLEKQCGVRVTHGTETIQAGVANAQIASQLGINPGAAVLNATRLARVRDGTVVEYVERSYRADRYRYRVELVRP